MSKLSKTLVLAEKPSVGRDLARVLNCGKQGGGFFEGTKYVVTWALGHLVTLADPEAYNDKYASWRLEDLPMLPAELKLVVIKQTNKQYQVVKAQLARQDVDQLVIATDAGREGELVARWIIEKARVRKPIKRLWISSVTDKAIREGFSNLRNGREYENLYASAVARAEADWLVGINATRALTCKHNAQLSCGRVQTPTLAMIAKREAEIQGFKPRPYYGITAQADGLKLTWQDNGSQDTKTFDQAKAAKIVAALRGKDAVVTEVGKVHKKTSPPQLYDLTELQRDANKIFGFSAKETLSVMQSLYENHKVLTYPRTDSRYLSTDLVDTLPDRIKACGQGPYARFAARILGSPLKVGKSFVDNGKVSDHHAIIPTEQAVYFGGLNEKERKIYDLVAKRFLAVFYPPFEYEQTTLKARIADQTLAARGKTILNQGWKALYDHYSGDEEDSDQTTGQALPEQILPKVSKGDVLRITALHQTQGQTKPPAPLNEATLLSAMEKGGLGTVATRADIIEKLFNSFLIEKKGKDLWITSKGRQLLELVPDGLKTPALTAEWEQKLMAISKGTLNKNAFIAEMKNYAKTVVGEIKASQDVFRHDNLTRTKCPDCGKYMLEVNGKKGKMLVCQDRECGHRVGIARTTNARCPNCHKKLELRGEGEGQIFVCRCGYREKLAAFVEKRKNDPGKLSKRDVTNYIREQKKSAAEPINTALADALAKLKLK